MDKKTKGNIAEMIVASHLLEEGWKILVPFGENHRYDLVAERKGVFVRVQVKYVTPKNGALEVNCRSSNNWSVLHYTKDEIDFIAVCSAKDKQVYFIPVEQINRSSFKLRIHSSRNNQKSKTHQASAFTKFIP